MKQEKRRNNRTGAEPTRQEVREAEQLADVRTTAQADGDTERLGTEPTRQEVGKAERFANVRTAAQADGDTEAEQAADAQTAAEADGLRDAVGVLPERAEAGEQITAYEEAELAQSAPMLSPGRMVFKRFLRNRLAAVGAVLILLMLLFSFVGGMVTPYRESELFLTERETQKDYAAVTQNTELRYTVAAGESLSPLARTQFLLARQTDAAIFTAEGQSYGLLALSEGAYRLLRLGAFEEFFSLSALYEGLEQEPEQGGADLTGGAVVTDGERLYFAVRSGKVYRRYEATDCAVASIRVLDLQESQEYDAHALLLGAEEAWRHTEEGQELSFTADGSQFVLTKENQTGLVERVDAEGRVLFGVLSPLVVQAEAADVVLSLAFRTELRERIAAGIPATGAILEITEDGQSIEYEIVRKDRQYMVRRETTTRVIDLYAAPSRQHLLGTDGNGMDVLTRLMYGGRISLLIGFVVVAIEVLLGIVIGGIAGYFGGIADNLLMRLVDLFHCIPGYPIYIIAGAIMDSYKVDPKIRIYYLMLILGLLGWPTIARVVRGQILSLREQEFMTATEALGIRVRRRIFRHLIPNVIPQLIVFATMGLGSVILSEATLSFLGLGVKFPYASWGNMINAVNDVYVMTNYWFVWIPAGLLILLTVLGFNFIGDGLRDAFDPRMKR